MPAFHSHPENEPDRSCVSCNGQLYRRNGVWLCEQCNSRDIEEIFPYLLTDYNDEFVFIECPGASHFEAGTTKVVAGVEFVDENDPFKGYRIVEKRLYAPTHTKLRRIRKEALGSIRRCQGCQDYTVRMRRPEGRDFCIPSHKHPNRKQLKPVNSRSYV